MRFNRLTRSLTIPGLTLAGVLLALVSYQWPLRTRAAQAQAPKPVTRGEVGTPSAPPKSVLPNAPLVAIVVNSLSDTQANDGVCTLREALLNANANNQSGSTDCVAGNGADTIIFTLTGTLNLTGALPVITDNLTISGPGANLLTVRRNTAALYRIFTINGGVTASLTGLTIANGDVGAGDTGGGVRNDGTLTITNCAVTGNHANGAGGVDNHGTLTMTGSTLSGNAANFDGGGLYNIDNGTATLTNCTISGNAGGAGFNGGIATASGSGQTTLTTLTNCTVTANTGGNALGRVNFGGATAVTVQLKNTLVAANGGANFASQGVTTLTSLGNNLDSDGTSGFTNGVGGNLVGTIGTPLNAMLGTLADNGGGTLTHALMPGSPALDKGGAVAGLTSDQRGFARPVDDPGVANAAGGDGSDIGAFEGCRTFIVNDLGDTADANVGNGVCADAGGKCTLRAAIQEANTGGTCGTGIGFSVTGTINLTGALPDLNNNIGLYGPGANLLTVRRDTGGDYRIFNILAGKLVMVAGLTISNGKTTSGQGGGILNNGTLSLANCVVAGNQASASVAQGGGIYSATGTLNVTNCTFTGNSASSSNSSSCGSNLGGGGIFIGSGVVNVAGSTFTGNSSTDTGTCGGHGGGGIYLEAGTLNISNSTLSGNNGNNNGAGGGLRSRGPGSANLVNTTITNNFAGRGGGFFNNGGATAKNTIIAQNTNNVITDTPDFRGPFTSLGNNLIGIDNFGAFVNGVNNDQVGSSAAPLDAKLAPLGNYGGPTQTHALRPGSPAIDKGGTVAGLTTDQRGFARPVDDPNVPNAAGGNGTDIGAYEAVGLTSLIVNDLGDTPDANVGNNVCADAGGKCTLRAALQETNARGGGGIGFSVTGTINLTGVLPDIDGDTSLFGPGASQLTVRRNTGGDYRIFLILPLRTVAINGLTISNGKTAGPTAFERDGGGIGNRGTLSLNDCVVSGNMAVPGSGGGVRNFATGQMSINNCALSGNTADSGGAITTTGGPWFLTNSTVSGNTANFQAAINSQRVTGTLTNVTISGNTAGTWPGGVFNAANLAGSSALMTLTNCTVTGNVSTDNTIGNIVTLTQSGGLSAVTLLRNTLVAANTGPNFTTSGAGATLTSLGNNLDSDGTSGFVNGVNGNLVGTVATPLNAVLGVLANNGGPTQTHALLSGSPALDKGQSVGLASDQRGLPRPVDLPGIAPAAGGDNSDIGAYEAQSAPPLGLFINDVTVAEGNAGTSIATFNVTLSAASAQTVTVQFATADGTATAGSDYTAASGTLTFNPGVTSLPVNVTISGDTVTELSETFFVNLSNPANAALGDAQGVGTILNDEPYIVTNANDAGAGSLRQALLDANASAGADTIVFEPVFFSTPRTINLASALPDLTGSLTLTGPGANLLTVRRNTGGDYRIFNFVGTVATLSGLTITNGNSSGFGGGVSANQAQLTINDCVITGNQATTGGGVSVSFGSPLTINRTTISNNTASQAGGIYSQDRAVLIQDSTISGNVGADTGGIRNSAGSVNATMTLTNTTVSGNTSTNSDSAIRSEPLAAGLTSTISLTNCTVTNNSTASAGQPGAIWLRPAGGTHVLTLKNTIVSGNTSGGVSADISGTADPSSSFNLVGVGGGLTNGVQGNLVGVNNPLLGALANNGGPTLTHLLLAGSPARNAGNNTGAPTTDQRGFPRPVGATVDIGAVENDATLTIAPTTLPNGTVGQAYGQPLTQTGGAQGTILWTVSTGTLPAGLTLNPATGLLAGTPTGNGTFNFTVTVTSSDGLAGVRSYALTITCPAGGVQLLPASLAAGVVGMAYNQTLTASCGAAPYTFSVTAGAPPTGVALSAAGVLGGTPTVAGVFIFTAKVTDNVNAMTTRSYVLRVHQKTQLLAQDGATENFFGNTVALSGDTALVGAPGANVGANAGQGAAYIYVRNGAAWTQQAKLLASDGAADDGFGNAVALSGDTALVGAFADDVGAVTDQGSAYIFVRNGTNWTQQAKLTASDGAATDLFGSGVALSGDTALIGAYTAKVGANAAQGAAYVFVRSGTNWTQQQKLTASDGAAEDLYGYGVAVNGNTALVGASFAKVGTNTHQGAAYVYVRNGTVWTQQAKLTANDGAADDTFGTAVALSGDTALVGADFDVVGANAGQGSAYVFVRNGANWTQQAKLMAGDGVAGDNFGAAVALSGDTALVAARNHDVGANENQGTAYLFARSGTVWTQQAQLTASDGAANDAFGYAVALGGDTALVGVVADDLGANADQGSVCVFDLCPAVTIALNPFTLPGGTVSTGYNQPLTVSPAGSYSFVISEGVLPAGLALSAFGVLSGTPTAGGTFNFMVQATDANGCTGFRFYTLSINSAPTFTPAVAIARQQGSPAGAAVTVGTVADLQTAAGSLTVTQIAGGTATGITVTGITNTNGTITTQISASCTATSGTVRFQVSDGTLTGTGDLQINVTANNPPTLTYANANVALNGATTVNPATGPVDNGTLNTIVVQSPGTYTGTISVNNATGVVSISNAGPPGTHTINIRATDDCGAQTNASFTLTIACVTSTFTVNNLGDGTDATPGNGLCETATGNGICTLRAAIQEANALGACAPFTINFSALFNTAQTINLASALPNLSHPNLTLNGPGANLLTVRRDTGGDYRIFQVNGGVTATIQGLTISNGVGTNGPGGILNSGTLTITNCAIIGNQASGNFGGGIFNLAGTMNIIGSTISGNTAGDGAGLFNQKGSVTLTNTTISGNTATSFAGGIENLGSGGIPTSITLINCTVTGNTGPTEGGIATGDADGPTPTTTTLKNTIVANNNGPNLGVFTASGQVISQGNNLASDNGAGLLTQPSDKINTNPLLGALANNGGTTQTHALLPGSPAINAGNNTGAPATDQRGIARPQPQPGATTDIGAYESRGFTLAVSSGSGQSAITNAAFASPLVVSVSSANGEPVNGGRVTFTPPGAGASAALTGSPATIAGGQASVTATANATIGGPYNVAANATGAVAAINFALTNLTPNTAPTFTPAAALSRQQGSPAGAAVTVGTVADLQTTAGSLTVTQIAGGTATGISVTGITNTNGTITAQVSASCTATAGTVRFQVSDGSLTGTGDLQVNVTANTPPTLTYGNTSVAAGAAATVNPATGPSDNGTLSSITVQSAGTYTGALSVDNTTGVVSLNLAKPAGTHTIIISATDNCGTVTNASFTVTVTCPTLTVNPATLPNGFVGTAYSQTLTATGGTAPYTFAVTGGNLPGGLNLASGGALSGTPTTAGTFNFTVTATDSNGCASTPRSYTVIISGNGLQFYPLAAPVRLLDTRNGATACTQPNAPITGQTSLNQAGRSLCNIPANAVALTGNITTVNSGGGFLTLYPSNAAQPTVASTNYAPNEIINNVFTVGLGLDGAFRIFAFNTTDVVVDVTGYYAPPTTGGLFFHPLPKPIRLLETRAGQLGCNTPGVAISGGEGGTLTQQARLSCDGVTIPNAALAIVGNATTVGPQGGGFLTLFPANAARPLVATSNYNAGQIVNGPFTVGLAPTGEFKIFTTATTDLVVDVLGYFSTEASDANGAGLLLTPLSRPVRLLETRAGQPVGCFKPGAPLNGQQEYTQPARGLCDGVTVPPNALGVVGNATIVLPGGPGFLTLWPSTAARPLVATANYNTGDVVNRHFIVGLGNADGAFKLFSAATSNLVIDLSGYFAP